MRNYVQPGDTITFTAPYAVASGGGFLVGAMFAVAASAGAQGQPVEGVRRGVFDLAKAAVAVTPGAKLYWDDTARNVTTTATSNTLIGGAGQAAASGDTAVRVALNQAVS